MSKNNDIDFASLFILIFFGLPMLWSFILMIQFVVSMIGAKFGYYIPIYMLPWEEPT